MLQSRVFLGTSFAYRAQAFSLVSVMYVALASDFLLIFFFSVFFPSSSGVVKIIFKSGAYSYVPFEWKIEGRFEMWDWSIGTLLECI